MSTTTLICLPSTQGPPFDVAGRLEKLHAALEGTTVLEQKENIKAAIDLYHSGYLPKSVGTITVIQDGQVCEGIVPKNGKEPFWVEVCSTATLVVDVAINLLIF